jgi:uncharacterized membrane protein
MSRVYLVGMLLLAFFVAVSIFSGQTAPYEGERLILNVYLDETGKALATGYAQDLSSLSFLNQSQYRYENDTGQLYALTNSLTRKEGDLWTLRFASRGYYDDYHVTLYLPGNLLLKRINSTSELEYFISTANQSLVADFQGYEIQHPAIIIEYQQPLVAGRISPGYNSLLLGLIVILAAGSAMALIAWRHRSPSLPPPAGGTAVSPPVKDDAGATGKALAKEETAAEEETTLAKEETLAEEELLAREEVLPEDAAEPMEASAIESELEEEPQDKGEEIDSPAARDLWPQGGRKKEIEVSSEMAAVMETLTPRERAILKALIAAGGRMTQADLRYETGTPKSSLSGILLSLERRKLIVKKEWGRTNVIELSDWFLSQGEGS